jgi:hypothetical protein
MQKTPCAQCPVLEHLFDRSDQIVAAAFTVRADTMKIVRNKKAGVCYENSRSAPHHEYMLLKAWGWTDRRCRTMEWAAPLVSPAEAAQIRTH